MAAAGCSVRFLGARYSNIPLNTTKDKVTTATDCESVAVKTNVRPKDDGMLRAPATDDIFASMGESVGLARVLRTTSPRTPTASRHGLATKFGMPMPRSRGWLELLDLNGKTTWKA